jgi:putative membrane protein (TIGR04086 family)
MLKNVPMEIKGLGRALGCALTLGLVATLVVYYSNIHETLLNPLGKLALIVSVFWGGCYVSKSYGSKGMIRGMSLGLMFFIVMLIAALCFAPAHIDFKSFVYSLLLCVVSGGLGGILGIGLSLN